MPPNEMAILPAATGGSNVIAAKKVHFLALPEHIRRKIYLYAGVPTGQTFTLNRAESSDRYYEFKIDQIKKTTPLGLFRTCSQIYHEVSNIFYGENKMIIVRDRYGGLECLDRLTASTMAKLRFLVLKIRVVKSETGCTEFATETFLGGLMIPTPGDIPLDAKSSANKNMIKQWSDICKRLAKVVAPDTLSLHVLCDCNTLEAAKMIAAPLLSLPSLKDCTLRLAHHLDSSIRQLAFDTVQQLVKQTTQKLQSPAHKSFDPPIEIQRKIVEYAMQSKYQHVAVLNDRLKFGTECSYWTCYVLTGVGSQYERIMCVCERTHSAASNGRCHCLGNPLPASLFLVSKTFRSLALEAFYSKHKFTIFSNQLLPNLNLFTSVSLSKFPKDSIRWLRRVEFQLVYLTPQVLPAKGYTTTAWNQWRNTIDKLVKYASLSKLDLVVSFPDPWSFSGDPDINEVGPPPQPVPSTAHMKRAHAFYKKTMQLAAPLAKKGLKSFVVYLDQVVDYRPGGGDEDEIEEIAAARRGLERQLEQIVMGANWDAKAAGVKEPRGWLAHLDD